VSLKYKHTILLVDDEASIVSALKRLLRKGDHQILSASGGQECLEILGQLDKPLSLIISDQRMPAMTGAELLEKAKDLTPHTIRFLLTGYSDMEAVIDAVNRGQIHRYLTKPWNDDDLLLQVKQALEHYELSFENRRLLALTKRQNRKLKELNKSLELKVEARSREIIEKNRTLSVLNKELESNLFNTVRAFAALTEINTPVLSGHARRVGRLSQEISNHLQLPETDITQIEIAALLHDIGKIGFPEKLQTYQTGKWTSEETSLFERHPEEGQKIVGFIRKLDIVGRLIRGHHERYDGEGYPDRLSREDIPIGSRIIAVADAYDKTVHMRINVDGCIHAYLEKKEMPRRQIEMLDEDLLKQAAISHLKQGACTRYDPEVAEVFLELIRSRGFRELKEKVVPVEQLAPGMTLTRSLYTSKGRFLLAYNTTLTEEYVQKIKRIHLTDPVTDLIYFQEDPSRKLSQK
jgi:response regulator RpfG family c-di-GMP phosphodiesterase